jgi:hypothetical protein
VVAPRSTLSAQVGDQSSCPSCKRSSQTSCSCTCCSRRFPALHVCHQSLCRQSSAPSRARPCLALRKCGESARPEHWGWHPTAAPRERTLPGTRLHLWAQTCSPPLAAARRIYLAAPDGRLRTPRVLAAWPAGAPARVGLLAAQTLAATHANRGRTAHLPRGARSRHLTKRHRVAGDSVMVAAVRRAYVRMSSPRLLHGRSRGHWQRSSAGCAGRLAGGAGCAAAAAADLERLRRWFL